MWRFFALWATFLDIWRFFSGHTGWASTLANLIKALLFQITAQPISRIDYNIFLYFHHRVVIYNI